MKKLFMIVIAMLLTIGLLSGCGVEPEQYVQMGDDAITANEFEKALEYYQKAGELGVEKRKNLLIAQSRARNRNHTSYDKSLAYLMENGSDVLTEEEMHVSLVEHLDTYIEEKMEMVRAAQEAGEKADWHQIYYKKDVLESAQPVIKEGTPGLEEVLDKAYLLEGWLGIEGEAPEYEYVIWYEVLESWSKCNTGTGAEVTRAVAKFHEGSYAESAEELTEALKNEKMVWQLWLHMGKNVQIESNDRALSYGGAFRNIYPDENAYTLAEMFETHEDIRRGSNGENKNTHMTEAMINDLKENCGKEADGKVLILHSTNGGSNIDIDTVSMSIMPDRYYPYDVESVRYVIVLAAESVETGLTYDKGTKQLREDVTLMLYDAVTGEMLKSITAEGPTSMFITYYGETPEYYSAGKAYIGDELVEICKAIEE